MTTTLPPSFASTDELLTAYWAQRDRLEKLERFRSNVSAIIDSWNAGARGDETTCHAVAFCVREVKP
jgi:hypothetical protein